MHPSDTSAVAGLFGRLWTHRWAFIVPVAACVLVATLYAVRLPDVYEAKALVHTRIVRPEHIGRGLPEEREAMPEEILATIRDRLLAAPGVEAAAPHLAEPGTEPSEAHDGVRAAFNYEQIGSSAFAVSLTSTSPERAAAATNALVEAFLERERAARSRRARSKLTFHQGELATARKAYREARAALDAARESNAQSVPERQESIQDELRRITTTLASEASAIAASRDRIRQLDDQLAALVNERPRNAQQRTGAAEEALTLQLGEAQRTLASSRRELSRLRARYTEQHPDVVRMRTTVGEHETTVRESIAALERVRQRSTDDAARAADAQQDARRTRLRALRQDALDAIARSEQLQAERRTRQATLQSLLDTMPSTANELRPLQLELEETSEALASRRRDEAAARGAVEFYRSGDLADVTGFRVDSWAEVPREPTGPARWRFLATAILLGSLIGYGITHVRSRARMGRVHGVADMASAFPGAMVVAVPDIAGRRSARRGRRWVGEALAAVLVVACVGLTVLIIAAHRGWSEAPAWVLQLVRA